MDARRLEKREIARTMMADDEPIERIVKYTGLTRDEVESLSV